jgi:predicted DNA binding protein
MRRLILEISGKDMKGFRDRPSFKKLKALEILHFLRYNTEELAAICKIEFNDRSANPEQLVGTNIEELQVLEKTGDGSYIVFIRGRPKMSVALDLTKNGGYLFGLIGIRDEKLKLTFLGSAENVKELLSKLEKLGVKHRVISLDDAKFSPNSPLTRLTEKQRRIFLTAFRLGYFDVPKRINSVQLSKELDLGSSTVIEHLRKAEHRIFSGVVNES